MGEKIMKLLQNRGDNYILPFFWQHGETEDVLRTYMKAIDECHIGAVCVESRPHPDFCGPKWWQDMDVILDEARKRGMKVWILDDSHFPTGFANGAMKDEPDALCRQSLCCRTYDLAGQATFHMDSEELLHPAPFVKNMIENFTMQDFGREFDDDRLFGLYAVRMDGGDGFVDDGRRVDLTSLIKNGVLDWEVPEGHWKAYALHLSRNMGFHRTYINMLSRSSCKVLLDAVYEPHWEHYRDDFGTTIAGFFSDEPELGNGHLYEQDEHFGMDWDYPWSDETEDALLAALGPDACCLLALLWENDADADLTARVRYTFMDVVTRLVEKDFSYQIGDWCRAHGVAYIGHVIEDNNHHSKTSSSLGHYFRGLAGQDMAGIDDIGGQVMPQGEYVTYNKGLFQRRDGEFYHFLLGKLASSAAAIEPGKHGNSMCEIFGNYGWQEGLHLEKYLADHFLVRGINHFVPHAFSAKDFPDPDCPPHFYAHGHNPQYRHFGELMKYMNRVAELISGGRHVAPVAVIYHGEGEWTGEHMTDDAIGSILCERQIEYDILPQDVFARPADFHMSVASGALQVNTQSYRVVLIPYMEYITRALAEQTAKLHDAGVDVIFVGGFPKGLCDSDPDASLMSDLQEHTRTVSREDLIAALADAPVRDMTCSPQDTFLRFIHYIHPDNTSIYMLVNEGTDIYRGTVSFAQDRPVSCLYDAWNNALLPTDTNDASLNVVIEPLKSLIVVFDPDGDSAAPTVAPGFHGGIRVDEVRNSTDSIPLDNDWKRSICRGIDYPAFSDAAQISLPDPLAEEQPDFSGYVRYENTFVLTKEQADAACAHRRLILEITQAYEGVEVFVNDKNLGIQIVPEYLFDLTDAVFEGRNTLRIEVATTLERETFKIPDRMGRPKPEPVNPSGISGEVRLVMI